MTSDQINLICKAVRTEMVYAYMERRPMTVLRFS